MLLNGHALLFVSIVTSTVPVSDVCYLNMNLKDVGQTLMQCFKSCTWETSLTLSRLLLITLTVGSWLELCCCTPKGSLSQKYGDVIKYGVNWNEVFSLAY